MGNKVAAGGPRASGPVIICLFYETFLHQGLLLVCSATNFRCLPREKNAQIVLISLLVQRSRFSRVGVIFRRKKNVIKSRLKFGPLLTGRHAYVVFEIWSSLLKSWIHSIIAVFVSLFFEIQPRTTHFNVSKEMNRHCLVAQFARNVHWAEPSLLFAPNLGWKTRPSPLKCKTEHLVFARSETSAA